MPPKKKPKISVKSESPAEGTVKDESDIDIKDEKFDLEDCKSEDEKRNASDLSDDEFYARLANQRHGRRSIRESAIEPSNSPNPSQPPTTTDQTPPLRTRPSSKAKGKRKAAASPSPGSESTDTQSEGEVEDWRRGGGRGSEEEETSGRGGRVNPPTRRRFGSENLDDFQATGVRGKQVRRDVLPRPAKRTGGVGDVGASGSPVSSTEGSDSGEADDDDDSSSDESGTNDHPERGHTSDHDDDFQEEGGNGGDMEIDVDENPPSAEACPSTVDPQVDNNPPREDIYSLTFYHCQWLLYLLQTTLPPPPQPHLLARLSSEEAVRRGDPSWARSAGTWEKALQRLGGVQGLERLVRGIGGMKVFRREGGGGYRAVGGGGGMEGGGEREEVGHRAAPVSPEDARPITLPRIPTTGQDQIRTWRANPMGPLAVPGRPLMLPANHYPPGPVPWNYGPMPWQPMTWRPYPPPPPHPRVRPPPPVPRAPRVRPTHDPGIWYSSQIKWLAKHEPLIRAQEYGVLSVLMQEHARAQWSPEWGKSESMIRAQVKKLGGWEGVKRWVREWRKNGDVPIEGTGKGARARRGVEPIVRITFRRKTQRIEIMADFAGDGTVRLRVLESQSFNEDEQSYLWSYHRADVNNQNWKSIARALKTKSTESRAYRTWPQEEIWDAMATATVRGGWYFAKKNKLGKKQQRRIEGGEEAEVAWLV